MSTRNISDSTLIPPWGGLGLYRMTVEEYERLAEACILKDPWVELIDGILVRKMTRRPCRERHPALPDGSGMTGRSRNEQVGGRVRIPFPRGGGFQSCPSLMSEDRINR